MDWVTRARPHVDRCASAWLVRRFVDPGARFLFAKPGEALPEGATPFDLPGVAHGHHGDRCTFETMLHHYGLGSDPALVALGKLVHDLDFRILALPESAGLDAILQGNVLAEPDDHRVLERGAAVFDALYARERARLEADA